LAVILQGDAGLAHSSLPAGISGLGVLLHPFQYAALFKPREWSLSGCAWQLQDTDAGLSRLSFSQQEQYGNKCLTSWLGFKLVAQPGCWGLWQQKTYFCASYMLKANYHF
jgi:hypothetical protein